MLLIKWIKLDMRFATSAFTRSSHCRGRGFNVHAQEVRGVRPMHPTSLHR